MSTDITMSEAYDDGVKWALFPTPEPEPEQEELEMAKKKDVCSKCGSDNLYIDELVAKEWIYDPTIPGEKEIEKPFQRITCLACGYVEDK